MKHPLRSFAASLSPASREGIDTCAAGQPLQGASHLRRAGLMLAATLAACSAWGQSVALTGVLGSKALLVVDGSAPKAIAVNESHKGVRLLQLNGDAAVVDVKGQRQNLRLGEAPVSLGSRAAATGAPARASWC